MLWTRNVRVLVPVQGESCTERREAVSGVAVLYRYVSAALLCREYCAGKSGRARIRNPVLSRSCTDHGRLRNIHCVTGWYCSQALGRAQGRLRSLVPNHGLSGAISGLQVLSGSGNSCRPLPRSFAQLRCCAKCSPLYWLLYLRKRSCRHTAAHGLQCFLSRSPTLSGSFQKNLRLS